MQAGPPHHRLLLPTPTPPPATKLLPASAAVSSSHRTIPSASSSLSAATTRTLDLPAKESVDAGAGGGTAAEAFWDYQFLFLSQRSESADPVPLRVIEGSVPSGFPMGTYYLAGPGLFADDHGSTVHPLDGHGYLRAFEFLGGGEVRYTARYVETEAQVEEREEVTGGWRFTHRGPFSVLRGGRRVGNVKVMKNVANTTVLQWGGRLLCLWEGGVPYEIDPQSLDTVGPLELIGEAENRHDPRRRTVGERWRSGERSAGTAELLANVGVDVAARFLKPILHGVFQMPPKRLLSHYKIDVRRNMLLVLSCNAEDMLLPRSNFTFYEFDCNFKMKQKKDFVISDQLMIHDWAYTDSHYILFGNRIKLDVPGSLLAVSGLSPMISALSVNPSQPTTPVYLLPRFSEGAEQRRDWRVPVEAPSQFWLLHVGNAFETADSGGSLGIKLQASVCSYQWFNFQKMFGYNWQNGKLDPSFMNPVQGKEALLPHLVQISIELAADGAQSRCSVANLSDRWSKPADFPAINQAYSGRRNSYIYAGTTSGSRRFLPHFPFDTVAKLNCSDGSVASWWAGSRRFIGEPIFVPRGKESGNDEEDDGYVLVVEYAVSKQRCYLVVLDARRMGEDDAVVAKLEVPKHLNFPLGFHGFWAER